MTENNCGFFIKKRTSHFIRRIGLLMLFNKLNFIIQYINNYKSNLSFRRNYPNVKLPPAYLMYESFGINYERYYFGGLNTAKWLLEELSQFVEFDDISVLDWGCGPGRVVRHLPEITQKSCKYFGADSNEKSILWCKKYISDVNFLNNNLRPPIAELKSNTIDIVIAISVFTHLSLQLHHDWYSEIRRILKPNGLILFTTHGDNFVPLLNEEEKKLYSGGGAVIRGKVKKGHRTYTAFHPKKFIYRLISGDIILKHDTPKIGGGSAVPQDVWIVKMKDNN